MLSHLGLKTEVIFTCIFSTYLFTKRGLVLHNDHHMNSLINRTYYKVVTSTLVLALLALTLTKVGSVMAAPVAGDYNGDGVVNLDDYSRFVKDFTDNYGKTGDKVSVTTSPTNNNNNNNTSATATPTPSPSASPAVSLTDANLLAYVPFEETSGEFKNKKASGAAGNLTAFGTVQYDQAGKVGRAVRVDGLNNSLCSNGGSGTTCKDGTTYDFANNFTIAAWVKFDQLDTGIGNIVARKWEGGSIENPSKGSYIFSFNGSKFYGSLSHTWPDWLFGYDADLPNVPKGRSFRTADTSIAAGQWTHVAFVRDSSKPSYDLYINGQLVTTQLGKSKQSNGSYSESVMTAANQNSADPFRLGEFKGLVDELYVYKKALTASEVTTLYTSAN
jgi:hypothetical protein